MDINWLEDFVCLARTGNFTRAAAERNVTQSAFSRRIQSLEMWAGAMLVNRDTYPTTLSDAGEELLPVAKQVLLDLLRTRDGIKARDQSGLKFYVFAAPHSVSINYLAPRLGKLESELPVARFRVISDNLHVCCENLSEGLCEFLLCYRHPRVPLTLDEQKYTRGDIGAERLVPVCVPDETGMEPRWHLPGERKKPVPSLAYAKGSFLGAVMEHELKGRYAALNVRYIDAFAEALKRLALNGAGVAWLPESSVRAELETNQLKLAGDDTWSARLTLSIFAETARLDGTAQRVWEFFGSPG